MFILKCNLRNYADYDTFYASRQKLNQIRETLEMNSMDLHKLFHEKRIQDTKSRKIGSKDPPYKTLLNNKEITSSNEEKI